jgi:hypothetical protein
MRRKARDSFRIGLPFSLLVLILLNTSLSKAQGFESDTSAVKRGIELAKLAKRAFTNLSTAEIKLLHVASTGETAWMDSTDALASDIPHDDAHTIDASLLRWLITDQAAQKLIDPRGIAVGAAWIDGELNLNSLTIAAPILIVNSRIDAGVDLISSKARLICFENSSISTINAQGLQLDGDLLLDNGTFGQIFLEDAKLHGNLNLDKTTLGEGAEDSGYPIVDVSNADIEGSLYITQANIAFLDPTLVNAKSATIHGDVSLTEFHLTPLFGPIQKKTKGRTAALDFSYSRISGILSVVRTDLRPSYGGIDLRAAKADKIDLSETFTRWVWASGLRVERDIALENGGYGQLSLNDAQIGGNVNCGHSQFDVPNGTDLEYGVLDLQNAQIGHSLYLDGDTIHVSREMLAINGTNLTVQGDVLFFSFVQSHKKRKDIKRRPPDGTVRVSTNGVLRPMGSKIVGLVDAVVSELTSLLFSSSTSHKETSDAKNGSIDLAVHFSTNGLVQIVGSRIGGLVNAVGCEFTSDQPTGLDLSYTSIGRALMWSKIRSGKKTILNLTGATAGTLVDDNSSWPHQNYLRLAGFSYKNVTAFDDPSGSTLWERLAWLKLQPQFWPQPYEMLATVLAEQGQGELATRVRIEEEDARARTMRGSAKVWHRMLGFFVRYGYEPLRAFVFVGVFVVFGWIVFTLGYRSGLIVPTEYNAYASFRYDSTNTPQGYQRFNGFVYSLESFLPLVQLFQLSRWLPDAQRGSSLVGLRSGTLVRGYLWLHVIAGWFFTTMLVAGLSGLVQK